MNITLTHTERDILNKYHRYLWVVHNVSLTKVEMISRLIAECGIDVDLLTRDLGMKEMPR